MNNNNEIIGALKTLSEITTLSNVLKIDQKHAKIIPYTYVVPSIHACTLTDRK